MVHIVTDSTSDIPADLRRELDITVVPAHIIFGLETFEDGINLTRDEFYQRLTTDPQLPTTSAPSSGEFVEVYQRLGGEIVSIHLASRLSAIYNAAHTASHMIDDKAKVVVYDTTQLTMGIGWLVIAAARAAQQGQSVTQIMQLLETMRPRVRVYAVLNTLEYMQRSGRVSWARGFIGQLLNIKPIVQVHDGEVKLIDRVRTRHKSIERLKDMVVTLGALESIAVLHTHAHAAAQQLADEFKTLLPNLREPIIISEATTAIGSYTGPNALGVAVIIA
jgi:DegV family protein with EDD domain